ncbi:hypothetical protein BDFG_09376 [Blastomyces dermatitidis ATCC 26199]|nr:hypothetical protein BDFG_09376 [Blastomyces dermatitidis ATCC 26199]
MQIMYEKIITSEAVKKNEQACKKNAKLQHAILKKQKKTDIMKKRIKQKTAYQTVNNIISLTDK